MSQMNRKILANDFKAQWQDAGRDVEAAVRRVGESGWYILGKEVTAFESSLATFWGIDHAVGCGNGMDAIEISLRALGLQSGDKVLTTPLSAFATTLAILRSGGVPVFVDTDPHGLIDLQACRDLLQSDPSIRFFVPVHLFGFAMNLKKMEALRDDFGLRIVEDCAQAIGAQSAGRNVGSVGQMATTSFYPTKNLGAMGDGGALLTFDEDFARDARALRDYGQSAKYVHDRIGLNSRLDELQAAILNDAMLPRLHRWLQRRRTIAERYTEGIVNPHITLISPPKGSESVWHLFPVLIESARDLFLTHLQSHGITGGIHYPGLITDQQAIPPESCIIHGDLQNAKSLCLREASLPIHPYLSDEDVEHVINICNQWTP
jgi:dTDP-4-amino-4,6-dideoxygalactose transaminase